jgi:hypothetical protein
MIRRRANSVMDGGTSPIGRRFYTLTREQKAERLEVADDLMANAQWWRGDPRLNSWQEGFLTNLVARLRTSDGRYKVSAKEWAKIKEIQDLMEREPDGADDIDC